MKNKSKILTVLFSVLILVSMLSSTAFAANVGTATFGIDVNMKAPDSNEVYDTQIYLYKVANAQIDETGNLHMEPVTLYQDLKFDGLSQKKVRELLDELCNRLKYPDLELDATADLVPLDIQKPGKDGMIHFDDLDAGVYLLIKWKQEDPDKLKMSPSLIYLPQYNQQAGNWETMAHISPKFSWQADSIPVPPPAPADPKLPQTGMVQWPVPILVIVGLILLMIGYGIMRKSEQD